MNAGVELKPGPSPAPERDPVLWEKSVHQLSPGTTCTSLEWLEKKHLGRLIKTRMGISASSRERAVGCNKNPQKD